MSEVALIIREESLAMFGGDPNAKLYRVFLKFDSSDEEIELSRTPDCARHYVARDKQTHYCLAGPNLIHGLPSPPKCHWMCIEVCPYKKQKMQEELDLHGKYFSDDTKKLVQDYLDKDNTIDWTVSPDKICLESSAGNWSYSK